MYFTTWNLTSSIVYLTEGKGHFKFKTERGHSKEYHAQMTAPVKARVIL
jgi:hypothetical protein